MKDARGVIMEMIVKLLKRYVHHESICEIVFIFGIWQAYANRYGR